MRLVLLAFLSFVLIAPKAEASRRDDDRGRQTSQSQTKGAKTDSRLAARSATPASAAPSRTATAPATRQRQAARQQQSTRQQQASRRPVARQQASRSAGRQQATRRPAGRAMADVSQARTQRSGLVVRGASAATVSRESSNCTRRNGRTVCGARRDGIAGWQAGLPQVNMAQSECPAGTFATLARGHENVVRCMPL